MTDKKYTDEDIISSLKIIATTRNCNECKIRNCKWGTCNCEQITANVALDLIKCLQSENEDLFYKLTGVMHSVDKWLDGDELKQDEVNRAATMREKTLQIVENLQSENEKLKNAYKQCAWERDVFSEDIKQEIKKDCSYLMLDIKNIKAEAYKEFAERLKEKAMQKFDWNEYVEVEDIDKLVKEMVVDDSNDK